MASRLAHLALLDALLDVVAGGDEGRTEAALQSHADVIVDHRL